VTNKGFTLIELSIVLVIIGLVASSVIIGQDMIHAAEVRAQITQIEKYQTAVNTFKGKYGFLPGDMPEPTATQFGFYHRGPNAGMGDGNGLIEGIHCVEEGCNSGGLLGAGETGVFWRDLSDAKLINNDFHTAVTDSIDVPILSIDDFWPKAKIGLGNYVYAWSVNGFNYYSISVMFINTTDAPGYLNTAPGMPVWIANAVDTKMDDGWPESGHVLAGYMALWSNSGTPTWAGRGGFFGSPDSYTGPEDDSVNCMNNHGSQANPMGYSMEINNGNYSACALSFQFQ